MDTRHFVRRSVFALNHDHLPSAYVVKHTHPSGPTIMADSKGPLRVDPPLFPQLTLPPTLAVQPGIFQRLLFK